MAELHGFSRLAPPPHCFAPRGRRAKILLLEKEAEREVKPLVLMDGPRETADKLLKHQKREQLVQQFELKVEDAEKSEPAESKQQQLKVEDVEKSEAAESSTAFKLKVEDTEESEARPRHGKSPSGGSVSSNGSLTDIQYGKVMKSVSSRDPPNLHGSSPR